MSVSLGASSMVLSASSFSALVSRVPVMTPAMNKGAKAAREFEAQLIGMVLQSMEKTFAALPGENSMAGDDNYNYLGTQALASAIAEGGGFGIAKIISNYFSRTEGSS